MAVLATLIAVTSVLGGLQLALGADIRIAAPDAKLALMELNISLYDFFEGMIYEQLVKTKTKQKPNKKR